MTSTEILPSTILYHNTLQQEYFDESDKKTMKPVKSRYVLNHIDKLLESVHLTRDDKILEVGCGMGKFTFPLLEKGFKISGLDLSPYLLRSLLEFNNNRHSLDLICSDILEIPEDYNESFDHVIGFFTLHHLHNLRVCYQAMSRVLKPGGKITFIEPNALNPLYYLQITFTPGMSWAAEKGIMNMHKAHMTDVMKYANLSNLSIKTYGAFPPFIANTKWGHIAEQRIETFRPLLPFLPFLLIQVQKPL